MSAKESAEIIQSLIEVGQVISQETSALVEAVMNLHLDQEDTDKAIARMSIEANLAKARTDDQNQTINSLREELKAEKELKEQAEAALKNMTECIVDITTEFKQLKDKADKQRTESSGNSSSAESNEMVVKVSRPHCQLLRSQVQLTTTHLLRSLTALSRFWRAKPTSSVRLGSGP